MWTVINWLNMHTYIQKSRFFSVGVGRDYISSNATILTHLQIIKFYMYLLLKNNYIDSSGSLVWELFACQAAGCKFDPGLRPVP